MFFLGEAYKAVTTLRLVYNSPRFSEDLDFSVNGKIAPKDFKKTMTAIVNSDERFSITDLASEYYTHLAQIRIKESWQKIAISMKIEVSRRITKENNSKFANLLAKSASTNISVITKVFSLEVILEDKLRMIKGRKMPRDIFDIWFICEKLNKPFTLKNLGYPKGKIRQELRKFLPFSFYPVIEDLEKLNAKSL
ncbi:MAG: nucleotidyl transferase AbiEii/AbiGii toxin family protein [Candidatus Omnitrophica bacterium]|nr:nucleotidyl transferase AbiEii/AbiGii toxin family protein [Candidatus Omnitrophota bacterium]MCM8827036.1 nucleotidyl transferase AbiEii/AbiGii toxin family protein [Candidatus Omnitrophota bacterium]